MPSITDTVARVAAAGVPVLFLDTCSILDVIRAPLPERKLSGCVEAAGELVAFAVSDPPACQLVVGSFVPTEFAKNAPAVVAELERRFNRMDEEAEVFHRLCSHLALPVSFARAQYAASTAANQLCDLSHRLLQSATALDSHADINARAFTRVAVTQRRPCRQNSELKDCTVFEECLEVCRQLQETAFAQKLVFCTSKTNDYCAPGETPHPDVAADCASVGLVFTTTLSWAVAELKS